MLLGLAVGVLGAFVHAATWDVLGISVPIGLVLAVAAGAVVLLLARRWAQSRWGIAVVLAAWLAPVLPLSQVTGEGDLVLAADGPGVAYLVLVTLLGAVSIGMPLASSGERELQGTP